MSAAVHVRDYAARRELRILPGYWFALTLLAIVPGLCTGTFWNELFDIMNYFGGSVGQLMCRKARRQQAFSQQQDRRPDSNWDWLDMSRDALRQVLGFFIGETPVNPFDPAAAIATGPP